MEQAGHKCAGYVEINKYARKSYEAIHNTTGEWTAHDIKTVTDEEWRSFRGTVDVICGGFPCQPFSISGQRKGFDDTRGTLFFEIARAAKEIQPRYIFLENVKGLLSHNKGETFGTIIYTLDELGYDVEWQCINSKDYVPQNRDRVYIIGHLRGENTRKIFPFGRESCSTLKQIIGGRQGERVYDIDGVSSALCGCGGGGGAKTGLYLFSKKNEEIKIRDTVKTIRVSGRGSLYDSKQNWDTYEINGRIRKLTARECWRLQGFPDTAFNAAAKVNSDSQLYKQAGNAVTVNVIYEIAKRLCPI